MRSLLLVVFASIVASASAQANKLVVADTPTTQDRDAGRRAEDLAYLLVTAHPNVFVPNGKLAIANTPTMRRRDAERRAEGLVYLAANARTPDDVRDLAQKCHKTSARPAFCAIPEMRQIARLER